MLQRPFQHVRPVLPRRTCWIIKQMLVQLRQLCDALRLQLLPIRYLDDVRLRA